MDEILKKGVYIVPIFLKINGNWTEVSEPRINDNGLWCDLTNVMVKVSGVWVHVWEKGEVQLFNTNHQ
jgi:hypothetical protein